MKKYLLFQIIVAFLLTGCAMTNLKASNYVGKVYKNSIQLPDFNLPLPEGEWHVIGSGQMRAHVIGSGSNMFTDDKFKVILLKKTDLGQFHSSIAIITDMIGNNLRGYASYKDFQRTDMHHVAVKNNDEVGAHDSWLINHTIMDKLGRNSDADKEALNYLKSNKIDLPKIVITTYHHFTGKYNKNRLLDFLYYINPEIDGFDSPTDTDWSTCDWNPLQINKDYKKVKYIENLKIEGAAMHEKLRVAFDEKGQFNHKEIDITPAPTGDTESPG